MAKRVRGESRVAVYGALGANAAIAVTKFVVAALSGSSALLAEGIHSTVDTANEVLLLVGLRRSTRRPTAEHPFGYGKELYFWALVVAMVIFAGGGVASIVEGILRLVQGAHGGARLPWKLGVLGAAFVFESVSLSLGLRGVERPKPMTLWRALRTSRDPSVYGVVAEDVAALAGLVVAAVGVTLAHVLAAPWIDAASSVVIGAILCVVAVVLAAQTRSLLVGRSARDDLVESIRGAAAEVRGVERVGRPLTMQLGPNEILVNVDVVLERGATLEQMGSALQQIESAIRGRHAEVGRVFVEIHTNGDPTCPA